MEHHRAMRIALSFIAVFLTCSLLRGEESPKKPASPDSDREAQISRIRTGIKRLNEHYWSETLGIWIKDGDQGVRGYCDGRNNPPWWPSANAVKMLLDFMSTTGSTEYDGLDGIRDGDRGALRFAERSSRARGAGGSGVEKAGAMERGG